MELEDPQTRTNFKTNSDLYFQFKLARDLGMTRGELITRMSSLEYEQWVAFYIFEQTELNKQRAIAEAEYKKRK
ncbi:hypothetical protein [uncultured Mediterranean phage uvMED]|nr:hypothetical protein [uncultured Mediterranean phage uvMED]BAQ84860.1 hypothetical protein [uncultured Mediterranean phage uvMED]BAQ84911.1 Phage minor tail protein T [uncultured Mediterranean phage uvMED]BAR13776.1 hypothetical protein [uncultured Mediterranean phage uvMED]BAR14865.1 hypothetical protein [uncultured Mediterranean phage uvMED]